MRTFRPGLVVGLGLSLGIAGCASQAPDPSVPDDAVADDFVAPTLQTGQATRVRGSLDETSADASNLVVEALAEVLTQAPSSSFSGLRESGREDGACLTATYEDDALKLDFDGCDRLEGVATLAIVDATLQLSFEEDFGIDGHDLDGSVAAGIVDGALYLGTPSALTLDGETEVDVDLSFAITWGQLEMWGSTSVRIDGASASLDYGTAEAPLTYSWGCVCASSGTWSLEAAATLEEVQFDLDAILNPWDGSDDFPVLAVPIEPAEVEVSVGAAYAECGDVSAWVDAEDVTVEVATADLDDALAEACDAGKIDETTCDATLALLRHPWFPKSLEVDVPAEVVADGLEEGLQDVLDGVCGVAGQ